jgi:hypothetical protein
MGLWEFIADVEDDMLELNHMYSNDIYATLCAYGVEMARAAILKEISGVFAVYKIDVNMRHLELIADYMVGTVDLIQTPELTSADGRPLMEATSPSTGVASLPIRRRFSKLPTRPQRPSYQMRRCTEISMT